MTIIKKNPTFSIAFFCVLCQLVGQCFDGGFFWPLSKRSNAKNIAREWEGENIHTEELLYPPMHHPPPKTPHPCPWRHYTGNVRDKQADGCSPMRRQLVCGVCLEASRRRSERKVEVGFSLRGPGMAGCHAARWGKKGQLEEENIHYSSPVDH